MFSRIPQSEKVNTGAHRPRLVLQDCPHVSLHQHPHRVRGICSFQGAQKTCFLPLAVTGPRSEAPRQCRCGLIQSHKVIVVGREGLRGTEGEQETVGTMAGN